MQDYFDTIFLVLYFANKYVFTQPLCHEWDAIQGQFFLVDYCLFWIQILPSNLISVQKRKSLPFYLPIAEVGRDGFISFPMILAQSKTVSFKIWTLVIDPISLNNKHMLHVLVMTLSVSDSGALVLECGVPLHCHCFKVHSDPEWWCLLGSHLLVG